jgi:hypothetical protein
MGNESPESAEQRQLFRGLEALASVGVLRSVRLFGADAAVAYSRVMEVMIASSAIEVASRLPRSVDIDSIKAFQTLFRHALRASKEPFGETLD